MQYFRNRLNSQRGNEKQNRPHSIERHKYNKSVMKHTIEVNDGRAEMAGISVC